MNEQELRALVREAIDRNLRRPDEPKSTPSAFSDHASHILLKVTPGSQVEDGMCVIEPAVRCTHCGFCQSYGH
jgi:hypothetical protein